MNEVQSVDYWTFSLEEKLQLANEVLPFVHERIKSSLGNRSIGETEFNRLSAYWAGALLPSGQPRFNMAKEDFLSLSNKDKLSLYLESGTWENGIERYSDFAGESLSKVIEGIIQKEGKANILDIGCGSFCFSREVVKRFRHKVNCYGVSYNRPVNIPKGVTFELALAEVLPEQWTNKFDLITCFTASQYFYDHARTFNEAVRVVKPKGTVFYAYGASKYLSAGNDDLMEHLMGVKDETYRRSEDETLTGLWGHWIDKSDRFSSFIRKAIKKKDPVSIENKIVRIEERAIKTGWLPVTFRVDGLGESK